MLPAREKDCIKIALSHYVDAMFVNLNHDVHGNDIKIPVFYTLLLN